MDHMNVQANQVEQLTIFQLIHLLIRQIPFFMDVHWILRNALILIYIVFHFIHAHLINFKIHLKKVVEPFIYSPKGKLQAILFSIILNIVISMDAKPNKEEQSQFRLHNHPDYSILHHVHFPQIKLIRSVVPFVSKVFILLLMEVNSKTTKQAPMEMIYTLNVEKHLEVLIKEDSRSLTVNLKWQAPRFHQTCFISNGSNHLI